MSRRILVLDEHRSFRPDRLPAGAEVVYLRGLDAVFAALHELSQSDESPDELWVDLSPAKLQGLWYLDLIFKQRLKVGHLHLYGGLPQDRNLLSDVFAHQGYQVSVVDADEYLAEVT